MMDYNELAALDDERSAILTKCGAALRQCLPLLREDLDGLVSSNTAWTREAARDTGEALRCITATFTTDRCAEELADQVKPILRAIH